MSFRSNGVTNVELSVAMILCVRSSPCCSRTCTRAVWSAACGRSSTRRLSSAAPLATVAANCSKRSKKASSLGITWNVTEVLSPSSDADEGYRAISHASTTSIKAGTPSLIDSTDMKTVVGIAIGGALGALARFGLGAAITERTGARFPWGTFVVNISGAFMIGLLFVLLTDRFEVVDWLRAAVAIGFLGAYTTFSTLALDTVLLAEGKEMPLALLNIFGSLAAGVFAVVAGMMLGRVFVD